MVTPWDEFAGVFVGFFFIVAIVMTVWEGLTALWPLIELAGLLILLILFIIALGVIAVAQYFLLPSASVAVLTFVAWFLDKYQSLRTEHSQDQ
jgi:hypothetical protein